VLLVLATLLWVVGAVLLRPHPLIAIPVLGALGTALVRIVRDKRWAFAAIGGLVILAIARPHRDPYGHGRFFDDQAYHHQTLRALDHMSAQGADVSEVLAATAGIRAGDADGWYRAWTALGDRNIARARSIKDPLSRGRALLRAHTYYLRAEFFLAADDPRRPDSFARNSHAFYEGLDTLGITYEKLDVPYNGTYHLHALYFPPSNLSLRHTTIVFCGGFDSTLEELYFFLVAAARERGYPILVFEGPGQGSVLREQGLTFTPEWEKPTSAVLSAFLATHAKPDKLVNVGLSMGGYLAARAAAFDDRFDGVVSYDVMFDVSAITRRHLPSIAFGLRRIGLERLVELAGKIRGAIDPGIEWMMSNGRWTFGQRTALDIADATAAYTLDGVAERIHQDVLIFAGTEDQFVPLDQVERYQQALIHARSVTTHVYDKASGGSEHSQLGASTLWQADFFDWLTDHFEQQ
jgi:pimeloyl-ACP methyl ester carboxylesterase